MLTVNRSRIPYAHFLKAFDNIIELGYKTPLSLSGERVLQHLLNMETSLLEPAFDLSNTVEEWVELIRSKNIFHGDNGTTLDFMCAELITNSAYVEQAVSIDDIYITNEN